MMEDLLLVTWMTLISIAMGYSAIQKNWNAFAGWTCAAMALLLQWR